MRKKATKLQGMAWFMLYFSPFVFPLYLLRFKVAGIPFTVLEAYSYLFFFIYFWGLLHKQFKLNWSRPGRWYYLMAFVLLVGSTLGVLTAPHYIALPIGELFDSQMAALGVWKGWIVAPILYFFTFTQMLKDRAGVKKLLLNFVYSGAIVAVVSYGFGVFDTGVTYDFRLSGFFESANYLSLYLVPALLISVYYMLQSDLPKPHRTLNLLSLTAMVHALFMTQSYAAIIGVFGAIGLYILLVLIRQIDNPKHVALALAGLVLVFIGVAATQVNSPKFQQFLDYENRSSTSVRLEIYEVSYGLLKDYPLTGVGPGLFQGYYQTKGPGILGHAPMEWNIPHPHNVFFAFWLNAGILGFMALLGLLLLSHMKLTYPVVALWGIIIHGLFDTPFWKNDLAMIFWLILGAILILQSHAVNTPKKPAGPIRKRAGVRRSSSAPAKRIKT